MCPHSRHPRSVSDTRVTRVWVGVVLCCLLSLRVLLRGCQRLVVLSLVALAAGLLLECFDGGHFDRPGLCLVLAHVVSAAAL